MITDAGTSVSLIRLIIIFVELKKFRCITTSLVRRFKSYYYSRARIKSYSHIETNHSKITRKKVYKN